MSTPSTVAAVRPPHHFPSHYTDYPASEASFRSTNLPINAGAPHHRLPQQLSDYGGSVSTPDNVSSSDSSSFPSRPHPRTSKPSNSSSSLATAAAVAAMSSAAQQHGRKKADWNEFYKNGLPSEVIVIHDDDSSPEPATQKTRRQSGQNKQADSAINSTIKQEHPTTHLDKRRRVEETYGTQTTAGSSSQNPLGRYDESASASAGAVDRTASAVTYSTAPTSIGSTGSAGSTTTYRLPQLDDTRAGQKRKRTSRREDDDEEELQVVPPTQSWANYYPPPKPPVKAKDVMVKVIRDLSSTSGQKIDDDDGHFIVQPDTQITDRYTIHRLLGQGTFGKVVEAWDKKQQKRVAVKIIRAVPKYRDASRIELRVLSTLASNDRHNRNRCIHLRDCFDFRNHICIVTDLLGMSVFDFLKSNQFVPFPSTNIQSFARQLFTSVAFLHDLHLIHTDLKPENILLVNHNYQTFTYNRTIPSSSRTVQRKANFRKVLLDTEIRLIDFGSATFEDEYHSSVVSTRHYRAPEIILNLGWSYPCDIWSIGCILVEFFTGDALFQTHDNLEHLAMMEAVCNAKIDKEIIQKVRDNARRRNTGSSNDPVNFFMPRAFRLDYPNSETTRQSKKYVKCMKRLDETIPPNTEFNRSFLDLLNKIFVYDPRKRISAHEALKHPWFREVLQDDGTEALKIRREREARAAAGGFR